MHVVGLLVGHATNELLFPVLSPIHFTISEILIGPLPTDIHLITLLLDAFNVLGTECPNVLNKKYQFLGYNICNTSG